jgi:hypothetical protein
MQIAGGNGRMASDLLDSSGHLDPSRPGGYHEGHPIAMKKADTDPSPRKKAAVPPKTTDAKPPKPKKKSASRPPASAAGIPEPAASRRGTVLPSLTVIAARSDIGYGNKMFLRGTGPGLSWESGIPMVNTDSDLWTLDILGATGTIYCKFLINDETWSAGPDYMLEPGSQLEVTPLF